MSIKYFTNVIKLLWILNAIKMEHKTKLINYKLFIFSLSFQNCYYIS